MRNVGDVLPLPEPGVCSCDGHEQTRSIICEEFPAHNATLGLDDLHFQTVWGGKRKSPTCGRQGRPRAAHLDAWRRGIAGGSVYDALIGAAAVEHGLPLISRDQRARDSYRELGVDLEVLPL